MLLIIGLGNPGKEYENNRHNVGFMFIDSLVKKYNFELQEKPNLHLFKGKIGLNQVILLKPQNYMNNSGVQTSQIINFYKIPLNNVFVFYDDIEVIFGKIKYKIGGGDGGHNGIRSINANISKEYNRIRIGVDRPKNNQDVASYVLSDFKQDERIEIEISINLLIDNIENIINMPFPPKT